MATLDPELVKHALKTAQEHGFAQVELDVEGASFRAHFEPGAKKPSKPSPPAESGPRPEVEIDAGLGLIKSPLVGFYRPGPTPLDVGAKVKKGDVVAIVNALGIANDIESQTSGEIVEVLVKDGQPVEFGQVLAKVKI